MQQWKFCSVNMAAAGLYTIGGSFWEFGEPDWDHTKYFLMFGVAEDHDSNPIKMGLGKPKTGAKFVSVNPIRTGYSAIADEWLGIRPGTDGLLVMAIIRELLISDQIDLEYLIRYTNGPWLTMRKRSLNTGSSLETLTVPLLPVIFRNTIVGQLMPKFLTRDSYEVDGGRKAVPTFELMVKCLSHITRPR